MKSYIKTKKELAENLRFARKRAYLTQQDVADKLEIDRSTYAYHEAGKAIPNIFTLIKLTEIFNVDISYLIYRRKIF